MRMDTSILLTVLGTIGGVEGLIQLLKWWYSRKATARQVNAAALSAEIENIRKYIDWLEKRLGERDAKIDALYLELRAEQNAKLETLHTLHEAELKLKEAEIKKCHKHGCADRIPPSDY